MKLLVCVSKTPDTTTKISFTENSTKFDTNNVQYILNPYDEWYALVRAIELKEQVGGTVTVINVGPSSNDTIIRKALAIGADNAVRVDGDASSSFYVAKQIAEHAKGESYDVVFLGKETIDYNGSEVGAMISELLDIPYVSFGTSLEMNGNEAKIAREIEGGKELVQVSTPFVVSAAKGMAEQRIANMRGIMMAKRKPITVLQPVEMEELVAVVSYDLPPAKKECHYIEPENMDELVSLLHNQSKVI